MIFPEEEMKRTGNHRRCPHCGIWFMPDPYNSHSQEYCCRNTGCRKASHCASQRRHREKRRDDAEWKKSESERVKRYQGKHPGYWRREKSSKKVSSASLLRDFAQPQKVTDFVVLRDFVFYLSGCLSGFIGHSTGIGGSGVLRDDICSVMNTFYDKGIALSKGGCAIFNMEDFPHETQGDRGSGSAQARA
jgi:hypothetical protein